MILLYCQLEKSYSSLFPFYFAYRREKGNCSKPELAKMKLSKSESQKTFDG